MAHVTAQERASGTTYSVRWREAGRFRQKSFEVRRAAERFAAQVEVAHVGGEDTAAMGRKVPTFAEVAEAWLTADRPHLKQKTVDGYDLALRVHILPTLGARRINTITGQDIERWLADLRAKPKANGAARSEMSVLGTYKALARVFTYATRHRLIPHSPTVAVTRPRPDTVEARFLSLDGVETLAAALTDEAPFDLFVRLAGVTGLRAGEMAALRICDVDLLHGELQVRRTTSHTSAGWVTTAPKSARSRRDVPILHEGVLTDLGKYLLAHPHADDPDALLWPGKVPGHRTLSYEYPFDPKGFYRYTYRPAAALAGLGELKLHELRHTAATMWLENGISMLDVSRLLGHASYAVTDRVYAHVRKRDWSAERRRITAAGTPAGRAGRAARRRLGQDDRVVKAAPKTIRFLSDGSMKTEQGWHLFGGSALTPEAARDAARDLRVLVHHFGKPTEDITGDVKRIAAVLNEVTEFYDLFKYNTFIYSGDGAHEVLVIRWNH